MLATAVPVVINQFANFFKPNPTVGTLKTTTVKETAPNFLPWIIGGIVFFLFLILIFKKRR